MPELPEVEVFRRSFAARGLGVPVATVEVWTRRTLQDITPEDLSGALEGHSFVSAGRHGKYLFAGLDTGNALVLHFGMAGSLVYLGGGPAPPHTRVLIAFRNEKCLAYDDPRLFGRVTLAGSIEEFVRARKLGPDALDIPFERFAEVIPGRDTSVKSALMNQQLMAGLGNIYSDEVLFQAGIHPLRMTAGLSRDELDRLYRAMRDVLAAAIASGADPSRMPEGFLIPHRRNGDACPSGGVVQKLTISGRSAYFCPDCQK